MNLLKRIPGWQQIAPVYAVIVVMLYTWSLVLFFWRLPSFLYYSTLGEAAVIFSYMVVVDLLESLLVLFILLAIAFILPQKWFYNKFVTIGSSLVILSLAWLMFSNEIFVTQVFSLKQLLQKGLIVGLPILVITCAIVRIKPLDRFVSEFSNRCVIFLYIWGVLDVLAVLTVLVRNVF